MRKDGTRFWATMMISAVRDPSGNSVGFIKIIRDFTDRKLAHDRLEESNERLRSVVNNVVD
ncbi:PAS domain S-box protein, partial [Klebsiella pneumoniae]